MKFLIKVTFLKEVIIGENRTTYNSRILIILGSLAALEIYFILNQTKITNLKIKYLSFIKENVNNLFLLGVNQLFPNYFNIIKIFRI